MRRHLAPASGLFVLAAVVAGCAPATTPVSGKVTYQGKPVVWGNVSIIASDNVSYPGEIKEDGTFTIAKAPPGPCKIGVSSPDPSAGGRGGAKTTGIEAKTGGEGVRPAPPPGKWFAIPQEYMDPVTSGVKGEIKKGEPLNVELK